MMPSVSVLVLEDVERVALLMLRDRTRGNPQEPHSVQFPKERQLLTTMQAARIPPGIGRRVDGDGAKHLGLVERERERRL